MKAIVAPQYGSPDVLQYADVEKPIPEKDQVLIKIHAASVNAADWHLLRADPVLVRLDQGFFKPKNAILGGDIAGVVEAIGPDVKSLRVGDEVYGDTSASGNGGYAEYAAISEKTVTLKPQNLSFTEAAAVPLAGITALQGLRAGNIQAGQKILINGASGGVGSFAVQIAKTYENTHVTGVCSPSKMDLVQSIGADKVIDYKTTNFTTTGETYDLILDIGANYSPADYKRALTPNGMCILVGFSTLSHMFGMMLRGGKQIKVLGTAKPNKSDLVILREWIEDGLIHPAIEKEYALTDVPAAIRHIETGKVRGKVVIKIA